MASDNTEDRSLFVTNLERDVSDKLLYELFVQAGPIDECLIKEKSRDTRVGIIIYKHHCSVAYAKDVFDGTALFNKKLVMSSTNLMDYPIQCGQSALRGERPYIDNGRSNGLVPGHESRHQFEREYKHHNDRNDRNYQGRDGRFNQEQRHHRNDYRRQDDRPYDRRRYDRPNNHKSSRQRYY